VIPWWEGLLLGLAGASVADALKMAELMMRTKRWPAKGRQQRNPLLIGILIRACSGGVVASVVSMQHLVGWSNAPVALFLLGLASPTVVQQGTRLGRVITKAILNELTGGGGQGGAG